MSVVYYVQHGPNHHGYEVVRWENTEGVIKKLVVQTLLSPDKAAIACEIWRQRERTRNGQAKQT
jgi:hypothetical protein